MANDLGSIDYGYRLGDTPMGAWMQADEDNYKRQARMRAQQQQEEEFKRQAEKDKVSADYMRAQAEYMRDNIGARKELANDNNVLKQQQAAQEQAVRVRPLVMAIQDQVKKSQSGDMASLYKAAELHKQLEENFPEAAKILSAGKQRQPNRFQLSQGGQQQQVESQLDPETFGSFANNWPKDKVSGQEAVADTRAGATRYQADQSFAATKYKADLAASAAKAVAEIRANVKDKTTATKLEASIVAAQNAVLQAEEEGRDPTQAQQILEQWIQISAQTAQSRATQEKMEVPGINRTSPSKEISKPKPGSAGNPIKLQ